MTDAEAIRQIQRDIVAAVIGNVTDVTDGEWGMREWVHLFVDIEIEQDGARSSSVTFALARQPGQPLEKVGFRLPAAAKQRFGDLAEAMRVAGQDRWSTAQLQVEQDGSFAFEFSHDPPYRLGGRLVDTRFRDYLGQWLETPMGRRAS